MKRRFILYRRKLGGTFYVEEAAPKKYECPEKFGFVSLTNRNTLAAALYHPRANFAMTKSVNPQHVRYVAINISGTEAVVIRKLRCRSFWYLM